MSSTATTTGDTPPPPEEFYDSTPLEPHLIYQGEILADVPLITMKLPPRWLLLRTGTGRRVDEALEYGAKGGTVRVLDSNMSAIHWNADKRGDFAMTLLDKNPVIVLNQNCDVQFNDFLQVAPIYPVDGAYEGDALGKLKRGEIMKVFHLEKHPPEIDEESYIDFQLIQSIHKSYVKRIKPEQHFRLGAFRILELQRSITRYFGRPNTFDGRMECAPRDGIYLCAVCFYYDAKATPVFLQEGEVFKPCPICSGQNWIPKLERKPA